MIPRICANCAKGANVTDAEGGIAGTVCSSWSVARVFKDPRDGCAGFAMSDEPAVSVGPQDGGPQETAEEAGDGDDNQDR